MLNQFLRRLSVRGRIVGGFVILLAFLTLSVPLFVANHLSLTGRVQQLANVDAKSDRELLLSLSHVLSSRVNLTRYSDDLTPSASEALKDLDQAQVHIESARQLVSVSDQKSAMANILAGIVSYRTLVTEIQTARNEGREQDVAALLANAYQLEFNLEQQINGVVSDSEARIGAANARTLSEAQQRLILFLVVYAGLLSLAIVIAITVQSSITRPISDLYTAAEAFRRERKATDIPAEGADELTSLARSFNQITSELAKTLHGLEQRIADRTKALATSSEVSRRLSTILNREELVTAVVDQVREAFGYYHAQIYFYDEARENLVMAGGTGEAGRMMLEQFHKLAKGRGLVGRAAETNEPILVSDTANSPEWLPNVLLPETKSEVAIPISIGDEVLGVLDVQHNIVDGMKREDIDALQSISNQVAIASQNARLYTKAQRSQVLLSEALKAARLGNWEYDFEHDLFTFSDDFYSIFRTTAEKVGGYKISSADYSKNFVHPDDAALVGIEIQKVLEAKDRLFTTHLEHRIIFADGEVGYIAVNINVERDENGKITRWYGANQDITERRRLEETNRKRAEQQEAINLITQKIQSANTIEAALKVAARELGHKLGAQTVVHLEPGDGQKATVAIGE